MLVSRSGQCAIVLTERRHRELGEAANAAVYPYTGSSTTPYEEQATGYVTALTRAMTAIHARGRLALEPRATPTHALEAAKAHFSTTVSLEQQWEDACAVKLSCETTAIQSAAAVAWTGQEQGRAISAEDRSELAVFGTIRTAMELVAGAPLAVCADVLTGVERTARGAGSATPRRLQAGDPILLDIACRVGGYWADSADAHMLTQERTGWRRLHQAAENALIAALEGLRAGRRACDIDADVRRVVAGAGVVAYRHHTGHGIGARQHEEPRLIPGNKRRLRAGMVVTLELGAYDPAVGGVRLECIAQVGPDGGSVLGPSPAAL